MATTTAVPPAAPEPQRQMSAISRVFGVLFSPQKTFEDIVRKPSWWLAIALLTILSIAVSVGINQRVNWREFMSQQIEKSPQGAQLSAEQKEQRIEGAPKSLRSSPMWSVLWVLSSLRLVYRAGDVGGLYASWRSHHEFQYCDGDYVARVFNWTHQQPPFLASHLPESTGDT